MLIIRCIEYIALNILYNRVQCINVLHLNSYRSWAQSCDFFPYEINFLSILLFKFPGHVGISFFYLLGMIESQSIFKMYAFAPVLLPSLGKKLIGSINSYRSPCYIISRFAYSAF